MRTASIMIETGLLLDLCGIKHFNGSIVSATADHYNNTVKLDVAGDDLRLPEDGTYPPCLIICETVQSHFEKCGSIGKP